MPLSAKPAAYALYTTNPAEFFKYKMGNRVGMTYTDANQLAKASPWRAAVSVRRMGIKYCGFFGLCCHYAR